MNKCIAFVDDDRQVCRYFREYAIYRGYECHCYHEAENALKAIVRNREGVWAICVDLTLPGSLLQGPELITELRVQGVTAPIVVVTEDVSPTTQLALTNEDYDGNEISLSPVQDLAPGEGVVYFAVPHGGLYLAATDRAFPRVPRRAVAPKNAGYRADYPHDSAHFDVWRPDSRVQVRAVAAWHDVLYVACSDLGLVLLRRDSAGALVKAGRLGGRYVGDVKVVDGRLYAAEGTAGVAVYDLADPVKPREVARW